MAFDSPLDAHPQVLARLNKSMTLADFENAVGSNVAMFDCGEWRAAGAGVPGKAFVLTIHPERKEAEKREEEARVWISGIEAVKARMGVKGCSGYEHLHHAAVARREQNRGLWGESN